MRLQTKFAIFVVVIVGVYGDGGAGVSCLLSSTVDQVISLIENLLNMGGQPGPVQPNEIELWLYSQNNPNVPIIFHANDTTHVDPSCGVILLIHGWNSGPNIPMWQAVKNAYVARYHCNIIMVNWTTISGQIYTTSVSKLPSIATIIGDFLCLLSQNLNIPLSGVHLVGHSLGAQMSGLIGQHTLSKISQKLGRITGLDPAGPPYQSLATSQRLDPSDATNVDVIHCNEGEFGYCGNCGSVDFHVNCGSFQPGCPRIANLILLSILNPNNFVDMVGCSHSRCVWLMAESVSSGKFIAESCSSCPRQCQTDQNPTYTTMGENCPANPPSNNYWIPTASSSPYALGCPPATVRC